MKEESTNHAAALRAELAARQLSCMSRRRDGTETSSALREQWFGVMAAVKSAEPRVRLKALTWQELAVYLPEELQAFLNVKYGIVAPGRMASPSGLGV